MKPKTKEEINEEADFHAALTGKRMYYTPAKGERFNGAKNVAAYEAYRVAQEEALPAPKAALPKNQAPATTTIDRELDQEHRRDSGVDKGAPTGPEPRKLDPAKPERNATGLQRAINANLTKQSGSAPAQPKQPEARGLERAIRANVKLHESK